MERIEIRWVFYCLGVYIQTPGLNACISNTFLIFRYCYSGSIDISHQIPSLFLLLLYIQVNKYNNTPSGEREGECLLTVGLINNSLQAATYHCLFAVYANRLNACILLLVLPTYSSLASCAPLNTGRVYQVLGLRGEREGKCLLTVRLINNPLQAATYHCLFAVDPTRLRGWCLILALGSGHSTGGGQVPAAYGSN